MRPMFLQNQLQTDEISIPIQGDSGHIGSSYFVGSDDLQSLHPWEVSDLLVAALTALLSLFTAVGGGPWSSFALWSAVSMACASSYAFLKVTPESASR